MTAQVHTIDVDGGALSVGVWGGGKPAVVAVHGGTSSHRVWAGVVQQLDGAATVIAPDYRGANRSERVGPPYGLAAHADDVRRILDHFDLERAVITGWSLGGFIAANAGALLGDGARAVVLVDGGLPLPLPEGFDPEGMLDVLIEPAMKRYRRRFASRDEHRAVWRNHPSLRDPALWRDWPIEHVDDELEETEQGLRFRVNLASLRADVLDTLRGDTRDAATRVTAPLSFIWAERGLENEPTGYYPLDAVGAFAASHPMRIVEGHGYNHYTLMISPPGAALIAGELRRMITATPGRQPE